MDGKLETWHKGINMWKGLLRASLLVRSFMSSFCSPHRAVAWLLFWFYGLSRELPQTNCSSSEEITSFLMTLYRNVEGGPVREGRTRASAVLRSRSRYRKGRLDSAPPFPGHRWLVEVQGRHQDCVAGRWVFRAVTQDSPQCWCCVISQSQSYCSRALAGATVKQQGQLSGQDRMTWLIFVLSRFIVSRWSIFIGSW